MVKYKSKLEKFAETLVPKTEKQKAEELIAKRHKICRKCNTTYPFYYFHCIVCGTGMDSNNKLEIMDLSYLLADDPQKGT